MRQTGERKPTAKENVRGRGSRRSAIVGGVRSWVLRGNKS